MYGRTRSLSLEPFLRLLAMAYGFAVRLRLALYRSGIRKTRKLPLPVVSVGNITLGGTGKTPTVIALARFFREQGKSPAVLSRGYGRSDESQVLVVSDGQGTMLGPDVAGDEPVLIAHRLPGVPVVVGSDRYQAGREVSDRFRPDVLILDDGFQHVRLHRDLDIVLIDGADPFGKGRLFPEGILREPLSSLRRADVVLVTRADRSADPERLQETIRRQSGAAVVTGSFRPVELVEIATGKTRPLDVLRNAPVLAFAGIARPDSFEAVLNSLGAEIASFRSYPDHHRYSHADMKILLAEAAQTAALPVTTEKDGVKLRGMTPAGLWMLRVELAVNEQERWEEALCRMF